jgi:hypothetical protein
LNQSNRIKNDSLEEIFDESIDKILNKDENFKLENIKIDLKDIYGIENFDTPNTTVIVE